MHNNRLLAVIVAVEVAVVAVVAVSTHLQEDECPQHPHALGHEHGEHG
jgi:hypothetical protein